MMKYIDEFRMSVVCEDNRGNKWIDNIIVDAKTFDEAVVKINEWCDRMNDNVQNIKYKSRDRGYQMTIGGGNKW